MSGEASPESPDMDEDEDDEQLTEEEKKSIISPNQFSLISLNREGNVQEEAEDALQR